MVEPNRQCTLCVLFGDWCGRWTGKSYLDGPTAIYDLRSDIICPGILTRKRYFYRCWRPSLGSYRPDIPFSSHSDTKPTQAAKDVIASQDALIDIFERIENFFRRLEEYAEVPTTEAMKDIIVKIMVEVLGLFAIVTKEMKQGLASERMPSAMFPITDRDSEKYLKKLIGRKDVEDALSRLDKLTQEEARMAIAQVLKIADRVEHGVDNVGGQVMSLGNQVTGVGNQVTGVGSQVMGVGDQVRGIDSKVTDVEDKVILSIEGTYGRHSSTNATLTLSTTRWQGNKGSGATDSEQHG